MKLHERNIEITDGHGAVDRGFRAHGGVIEVAEDVACLQLPLANLCFVGRPGNGDRSWVLVDAGLRQSRDRIASVAAQRFGEDSRPSAIVLTHGHFDHVGAARDLAARWNAPIYAHRLELPYLTGRSSYPPPDPAVGGGAMSMLSRLFPRGPFDLRPHVRALPEDGSIPGMSAWRWLHTPGHSPGHVSLFRDQDGFLIAGDAFVTQCQESAIGVLTHATHVHRPPAYFTIDWAAARRSIAMLALQIPETAVTGHGLPIGGEPLRQGLRHLMKEWKNEVLPRHGRYVRQPAITNEHGVVSVPPPVLDRQLVAVATVAAAAVAATTLAHRAVTHRAALRREQARNP